MIINQLQKSLTINKINDKLYTVQMNAGVAELADALDLGSSGRPCRFDSCYPHNVESGESFKIKGSPLFYYFEGDEKGDDN